MTSALDGTERLGIKTEADLLFGLAAERYMRHHVDAVSRNHDRDTAMHLLINLIVEAEGHIIVKPIEVHACQCAFAE